MHDNVARVLTTGAALIAAMCAGVARADTINLNMTIRDFCGQNFSDCPAGYVPNPDFENVIADDRGIVQTTLGADGTPDYAGGTHPTFFGSDSPSPLGTLTTAQYFSQWYHNTPGYNQTTTVSLPLVNMGGGIYQLSSDAFFPIDGLLLGNQGQIHNYSFTGQVHTTFTYQSGQQFAFMGDDDVWVYINDQLVIDLGGVHPVESEAVDLDRLGLTVGQSYAFDFFFAERHTSQSNIMISTSIQLDPNSTVPEPTTFALLSLALGGFGLVRPRKRVYLRG